MRLPNVSLVPPMMRIVSRLRGPAALVAVLLTVACSLDVAGPSRGNTNLRTPTISARLDTVAWSDAASVVVTSAASTTAGSFSIVADGRIADGTFVRLTLSMFNIRGAGEYPIGVGQSVAGASAVIAASSGGVWSTPLSGVAGTLVLTEVTATRIRGTFTMSLAPQNSLAGTTLSVTGGQFDLPVAGAGAAGVLPENAGSKVSARLGSASFNGAVVTRTLAGDGLLIQGSTDTQALLIDLEAITAPGTYALSDGTPRRFIGVTSRRASTQEWSSGGAGSSGSVTITRITASRITGTFTATLAPSAGTTGTLSVTNGVFDVGR